MGEQIVGIGGQPRRGISIQERVIRDDIASRTPQHHKFPIERRPIDGRQSPRIDRCTIVRTIKIERRGGVVVGDNGDVAATAAHDVIVAIKRGTSHQIAPGIIDDIVDVLSIDVQIANGVARQIGHLVDVQFGAIDT